MDTESKSAQTYSDTCEEKQSGATNNEYIRKLGSMTCHTERLLIQAREHGIGLRTSGGSRATLIIRAKACGNTRIMEDNKHLEVGGSSLAVPE